MGYLPTIMAINLTYQNETNEEIDEKLFTDLLPKVDGDGDINLIIVDDAKIHEINREYRGKDKPTDVISFAFDETDSFPGENMLGEIYISIDTAKKQAEKGIDYELKFLFIHGVLHLLGYTHETDEKYEKMMTLTRKIIDNN